MNEIKNAFSTVKKNPAMMLGIAGVGVVLFLITKGNKTQAPAMDNTPVTYQIYPGSGGVTYGGNTDPTPTPTPASRGGHVKFIGPPVRDPRPGPSYDPGPTPFGGLGPWNPPDYQPFRIGPGPGPERPDDFTKVWSSMALTA